MLMLLLPLCCISRKRLFAEMLFVVIICSAIFIKTSCYVIKHSDNESQFFSAAHHLLADVPAEKKLLPVEAVPISNHLEAYYLIEKNGYVPTLFSSPYMMVHYRYPPVSLGNTGRLSYAVLRNYDYLFVSGDNAALEGFLKSVKFTVAGRELFFGVYRNALPAF
jgi:hypothetical protein